MTVPWHPTAHAICELNHRAAPQSPSFVSLPFRGACCKRAACTPFRYRARGQRVDAQFFSFSRAWACSQQRAVCNRATAASPRLTVLPCSRVSLSQAPDSAGMSHVRLHRHRRLRAPGQRGCQKRRHRPTRPSRAQRRSGAAEQGLLHRGLLHFPRSAASVRSRPGVARTILLFYIISVRPPKQPH